MASFAFRHSDAAMEKYIKVLIGLSPNTSDRRANAEWKRRTKNVCKPCWELKYCPYGPLVEQFPLPPVARAEMVEHNNKLKELLKKGIADKKQRAEVRGMVASFNPRDYPVNPDRSNAEKACAIFGHYSP